MSRHDEIKNAYRSLGGEATFYDGMITCSTLPDADITCLDYSPNMMERAKRQSEKRGLKNVCFRQGDVGKLPFPDGSFDLVLSLNGFHAFPDKEAAESHVPESGSKDCGGHGGFPVQEGESKCTRLKINPKRKLQKSAEKSEKSLPRKKQGL